MNTQKLIEAFIKDISCNYPKLKVKYDYDIELDQYDIWHIDEELEFNDKDFKYYVGEKAKEYLFDNNIYNFSFGYDHCKYKEFKNNNASYKKIQSKQINVQFYYNLLNKDKLNMYNYHVRFNFNVVNYIKIKGTRTYLKQNYKNTFNYTSVLETTTYKDDMFKGAA